MKRPLAIALVVSALLAMRATAVAAADGTTAGPIAGPKNVLTGRDAFGSWQDSVPGTWRLIRPADLPEPFATRSASNAPRLIARPPTAKPEVPAGFRVDLVKSGMAAPRDMAVAPNGDLFIVDSAADQIVVLRMENGQSRPVADSVFASDGLYEPYGIAFYPLDDPQWVYVGNSDSIIRFPYRSGDLKASGPAETLVAGIPSEHHWTRDIAFSPDGGTLYLAVGSGSNTAERTAGEPPGRIDRWAQDHALGEMWGEEQGRAAVIAYDPDGRHRRVYATGLRNCSGLTVQPATGQPWCVVNERDGLGDDVPSDYATSVQPGHFYGWPWYYNGGNEDPRAPLKGQRPDLAGKVTVPDVLFQAHSAPLNIAFYDGFMFPAEYKGDAFVAMRGSWNRENAPATRWCACNSRTANRPAPTRIS